MNSYVFDTSGRASTTMGSREYEQKLRAKYGLTSNAAFQAFLKANPAKVMAREL